MPILSDVSDRVELHRKDKETGKTNTLFPMTTGDMVLVDEAGNNLDSMLPAVLGSDGKVIGGITFTEISDLEITEPALIAALTSTVEETPVEE